MKIIGGFAIIAAAVTVFAAGCGGGNDNSGGTANVQGIWVGTTTSNAVARSITRPAPIGQNTLDIDFTQTGTTLSGTAMVIVAPMFYTATITGSISGTSLHLNIDAGSNGTSVATLRVNGTTITGNYTRTIPPALGGGTDTGTVNITKQVGAITSVLAAHYTGTSLDSTAGASAVPLLINDIQNGDGFTFSGLYNGANTINGSGTVIGNNITFTSTQQATGAVTYYIGAVSATGITGTTYQPGTNPGLNGVPISGAFTLNVALSS